MPNTIKELEKDIETLQNMRESLSETIIALYSKLKDMYSADIELENITPQSFMSIRNIDRYNTNVYRKLDSWFMTNYFPRGLYQSGEHIETRQRYIKLYFDQNNPFEQQLGIKDFIPYIEYNEIGIMEDSLSRGGFYTLINFNDKPELCKTTYSQTRTIKSFETLDEALRYVYDKLPCQRRK